jgi:PAS domain S-box-containing protein
MKTPRLSFKQALAGVTLAGSGLAVVLASVILVSLERARYRQESLADLVSLAQVLGASNAAALAFDDVKSAQENLDGSAANPQIVAAALYRPDGRPFATYQRPGVASAAPAVVKEAMVQVDDAGWVAIVRTIADDGGVHGYVYLRADTRQTAEELKAFAFTVAGTMLVCLAAAFFLATRLHARIADPLQRLAEAAAQVAEGRDYSPRLPPARTREVQTLTDAFEKMVAQIGVREDALRASKEDLEERVQERVRDLRHEVQERQSAERALRLSERKYRGIVETTNDWIWTIDTAFISVYNNPAVERILGYTPEEMVGRDLRELAHPEERPYLEKALASSIVARKGWSGVILRAQHRNGQWRSLESNGAPMFDDHGALVGFQGSNHDMTERRVLEEQLRQSQKMEAVGRLAGGVAHDFNNLLGVIIGSSELVLRQDPAPAIAAKIGDIRRAADRATGLTRQLLAFSRKQVLSPKVLDPAAAVAEFGRMLPRLIGEDIQVSITAQPASGQVKADPTQIDQVLMNLAINARDAMPRGGRLTLDTRSIDLAAPLRHGHGEVPPGSYVAFSVTDTGCGMTPDVLSHLFEPFFTTKEIGKGTGLGLPTVYGIVEQTGGHIRVESEVGRGTCFVIYLPRVQGEVVAADPRRIVPRRGHETVLLVEDEAALREITQELLELDGYRVLTAQDGAHALDISRLEPAPIDLLLTDVVMPGMSGPELADRILLQRPRTKVLFISGYTADAIDHHGVGDGGTSLLHKPFTSEALSWKVREVLGGPFGTALPTRRAPAAG